jgi:hypothetical protein
MEHTPKDLPAGKRISIIQSAYIPWKGFFDLINRCDEHVIFDSVQFSKGHWHNRNRIKTPRGSAWITIPVVSAGRLQQRIQDVTIAKPWAEQHWHAIEKNYYSAPFFPTLSGIVRQWYELANLQSRLTAINEIFLRGLVDLLRIDTKITHDEVYAPEGTRQDRVLDICLKAGATTYLSGPSARAYLDEEKFERAGVVVEWMGYSGYPEYRQLWGSSFDHQVSILDLLFNTGLSPRNWSRPCA